MSKVNVAEIAGKLFGLLEPLQSTDRHRVIQATLVLLGESVPPSIPPGGAGGSGGAQPLGVDGGATPAVKHQPNNSNAHEYFVKKDPHNKIEEFAVAARYREVQEDASTHSKDHLKTLIAKGARRNFDEKNFSRDLNNARAKGLFNKGADEKGEFTLAYYGQQY